MRQMVVIAGDAATAAALEQAGYAILAVSSAEDAVRAATANETAVIVLDRQRCGALELVAAVNQLARDDGRRVIVLDQNEREGGDDLTHALRTCQNVAVCDAPRELPSAVMRGRSSGLAQVGRAASRPVPDDSAVKVLSPQLISVVAAKGGVGKTFVATGLAALIAAAGTARTALADLAFGNADVGAFIDLPEGPTITDAVADPSALGRLPVYTRCQLSVLPGPGRPEQAEAIPPDRLEAIVATLRKSFEILILDLPHDPTGGLVYQCVDAATAVVLVSGLDAASLKDTRLFLNILKRLNVRVAERVRLVLNRVRPDATMDVARAEEFLGLSASAVLIDDPRAVDAAMYAGTPLALVRPNHSITQGLWQLAGKISPALERQAGAGKSGGFWRRSKGSR